MGGEAATAGLEAAIAGLHALSLCASSLLIVQLLRLPGPCRVRPLPRQLLWLAIADCAFHVSNVAFHTLKSLLSHECNATCRSIEVVTVFVHAGTDACLLFEICLALLVLLQSFRCTRAISNLQYSPLVVIPMSLAVSALEPFRQNWQGHSCQISRRNFLFVGFTLAAFSISLLSLGLGVAVLRRGQAPDVVRQRALRRIMGYVINTAVTELPIALCVVLNPSLDPSSILTFAHFCQACNGALNAATFFGQSRYAAEGVRQLEHRQDKQSFVVKFEDASEVVNEA